MWHLFQKKSALEHENEPESHSSLSCHKYLIFNINGCLGKCSNMTKSTEHNSLSATNTMHLKVNLLISFFSENCHLHLIWCFLPVSRVSCLFNLSSFIFLRELRSYNNKHAYLSLTKQTNTGRNQGLRETCPLIVVFYFFCVLSQKNTELFQ